MGAKFLRELAERFSAGWHDGIEIDATDVLNLCDTADELTRLRAELAASREREARMLAVLETWVKAADGDGNPVTTIIDFDKLVRAALAEGAQG